MIQHEFEHTHIRTRTYTHTHTHTPASTAQHSNNTTAAIHPKGYDDVDDNDDRTGRGQGRTGYDRTRQDRTNG